MSAGLRKEPSREVLAMEAHVKALLMKHGIEADWRDSTRARAWRYRSGRKVVRLARVRTRHSYVVALHEIGHLVARRRTLGSRCEKEATAWQWALDNSVIEWRPAEWRIMADALRSYLTWAELRQYREKVRPVMPVEGDHFMRLLDRAEQAA